MLAAALPLAAAIASAQPAPQSLRLVDLVGEFDTVAQRTRGQSPQARGAAVRKAFANRLPGFYDPKRLELSTTAYDRELGKRLAEYDAHRTETLEARARFARAFRPAQARFEREFGPVRTRRPVYLLVSLGEFDGATRDLPGGSALLFGADMIAQYHGDHDPSPFFQHELFHIIHETGPGDCYQLWCALWEEGLATYVASQLSPGATDAQLLLTIPEPIRPAVDRNKAEAVCAIKARLDLSENNDYGAIFSGKRLSPTLPPRFGYYVGMLVAADLGRTRTLRQLAALQGPELRRLIGRSLDAMAECKPGSST